MAGERSLRIGEAQSLGGVSPLYQTYTAVGREEKRAGYIPKANGTL
jgi:hypothetical protein